MSALAPIDPGARIHAIDTVRGFALLGIFMVNILLFGEPLGEMTRPVPGPGESTLDAAVFYFTRILCEGKFYPLFALLFGMGVALQWQRATNAGRPFLGTGFRRIFTLMGFGVLHALLLWYGDVLFLYSLAGILLIPLVRLRIKTLLVIGGCLLAVSVILTTGLFAVMSSGPTPPMPTPVEPAPQFDNPFRSWIEGFEKQQMEHGPSSPLWLQTETQAYSQGPYLQIFLFRAVSWISMLVFSALSFGWHIAAMFFFGAALLKHGVFAPERRAFRRRLLIIGLTVGLPFSVAAATLPSLGPSGKIMGGPLLFLGGPLLSLAYLAAITALVDSARARPCTRALANVGRMALTNYLSQSLIATTIFYYYGLGLFGDLSRTERFLLVLTIYTVQIAFSAAWIAVFRYGPVEWLWRSVTYLRPQPMRRQTM